MCMQLHTNEQYDRMLSFIHSACLGSAKYPPRNKYKSKFKKKKTLSKKQKSLIIIIFDPHVTYLERKFQYFSQLSTNHTTCRCYLITV